MADFPSPKKNALLARLSRDPRSSKKYQERLTPPVVAPKQFRRIASRGTDWGLSRTMPGYRVVQDTTIGGKATKWLLQSGSSLDDFYIVKFGNKNGRVEVYTELFNNELGRRLGFNMAHSGIARLDGELYFVTRNFRKNEALVHGSLMVEDTFSAEKELDRIKPRSEQSFYSINFVEEVIRSYCDSDAEEIFQHILDMLMFDALIGSMDRHAKNWGVLRSEFAPPDPRSRLFRLAPVFDSARALLWDLPEAKLLILDNDEDELLKYIESSRPCIGPKRDHPKVDSCNHFEFVQSLLELYPHQVSQAYGKLPLDVCRVASKLLRQFPFERAFSSLRKRLILKVLALRADRLRSICE
jgi:hypothetical protein